MALIMSIVESPNLAQQNTSDPVSCLSSPLHTSACAGPSTTEAIIVETPHNNTISTSSTPLAALISAPATATKPETSGTHRQRFANATKIPPSAMREPRGGPNTDRKRNSSTSVSKDHGAGDLRPHHNVVPSEEDSHKHSTLHSPALVKDVTVGREAPTLGKDAPSDRATCAPATYESHVADTGAQPKQGPATSPQVACDRSPTTEPNTSTATGGPRRRKAATKMRAACATPTPSLSTIVEEAVLDSGSREAGDLQSQHSNAPNEESCREQLEPSPSPSTEEATDRARALTQAADSSRAPMPTTEYGEKAPQTARDRNSATAPRGPTATSAHSPRGEQAAKQRNSGKGTAANSNQGPHKVRQAPRATGASSAFNADGKCSKTSREPTPEKLIEGIETTAIKKATLNVETSAEAALAATIEATTSCPDLNAVVQALAVPLQRMPRRDNIPVAASDTEFARIVAGSSEAHIVEDSEFLTIHASRPAAAVHLLVMPKICITGIAKLRQGDAPTVQRMLHTAMRLSQQVFEEQNSQSESTVEKAQREFQIGQLVLGFRRKAAPQWLHLHAIYPRRDIIDRNKYNATSNSDFVHPSTVITSLRAQGGAGPSKSGEPRDAPSSAGALPATERSKWGDRTDDEDSSNQEADEDDIEDPEWLRQLNTTLRKTQRQASASRKAAQHDLTAKQKQHDQLRLSEISRPGGSTRRDARRLVESQMHSFKEGQSQHAHLRCTICGNPINAQLLYCAADKVYVCNQKVGNSTCVVEYCRTASEAGQEPPMLRLSELSEWGSINIRCLYTSACDITMLGVYESPVNSLTVCTQASFRAQHLGRQHEWHPIVHGNAICDWLVPQQALDSNSAVVLSARAEAKQQNTSQPHAVTSEFASMEDYCNTFRKLIEAIAETDRSRSTGRTGVAVRIEKGNGVNGEDTAFFDYNTGASATDLDKGDRIILVSEQSQTEGGRSATYSFEAAGVVHYIEDSGIVGIALDSVSDESPNGNTTIESGPFTIRKQWNSVTYDRMQTALSITKEPSSMALSESISLVLRGLPPTEEAGQVTVARDRDQEPPPSLKKLSEVGQVAVDNSMRHCLSLIHGPPGTGKTEVASHIAYNWAQQRRACPILVATPSNTAATNMCNRLAGTKLRVIRYFPSTVGHDDERARVRPEATLEAHVKETEELKELKEMLRKVGTLKHEDDMRYQELQAEMEQTALRGCQVVCCTCSAAGGKKLSSIVFDFLLIDEAGQALEPEALIPITRGAQRVVLVGDHKQLGPHVANRSAATAALGISMFERLMNSAVVPSVMLNTQYRMHTAIASFPSAYFYDGLLSSGRDVDNRPAAREGFPWPDRTQPLAVLHVDGAERKSESSSLQNDEEVDAVAASIGALLKGGAKPQDIYVVTPYDAQRKALKTRITNIPQMQGVSVYNVDAVQGKESDFVILSLVRANDIPTIGFVKHASRANVALTRARHGLIVICNVPTLYDSPLWAAFIDEAHTKKLLVTAARDGEVSNLKPYSIPKRSKSVAVVATASEFAKEFVQPNTRTMPNNRLRGVIKHQSACTICGPNATCYRGSMPDTTHGILLAMQTQVQDVSDNSGEFTQCLACAEDSDSTISPCNPTCGLCPAPQIVWRQTTRGVINNTETKGLLSADGATPQRPHRSTDALAASLGLTESSTEPTPTGSVTVLHNELRGGLFLRAYGLIRRFQWILRGKVFGLMDWQETKQYWLLANSTNAKACTKLTSRNPAEQNKCRCKWCLFYQLVVACRHTPARLARIQQRLNKVNVKLSNNSQHHNSDVWRLVPEQITIRAYIRRPGGWLRTYREANSLRLGYFRAIRRMRCGFGARACLHTVWTEEIEEHRADGRHRYVPATDKNGEVIRQSDMTTVSDFIQHQRLAAHVSGWFELFSRQLATQGQDTLYLPCALPGGHCIGTQYAGLKGIAVDIRQGPKSERRFNHDDEVQRPHLPRIHFTTGQNALDPRVRAAAKESHPTAGQIIGTFSTPMCTFTSTGSEVGNKHDRSRTAQERGGSRAPRGELASTLLENLNEFVTQGVRAFDERNEVFAVETTSAAALPNIPRVHSSVWREIDAGDQVYGAHTILSSESAPIDVPEVLRQGGDRLSQNACAGASKPMKPLHPDHVPLEYSCCDGILASLYNTAYKHYSCAELCRMLGIPEGIIANKSALNDLLPPRLARLIAAQLGWHACCLRLGVPCVSYDDGARDSKLAAYALRKLDQVTRAAVAASTDHNSATIQRINKCILVHCPCELPDHILVEAGTRGAPMLSFEIECGNTLVNNVVKGALTHFELEINRDLLNFVCEITQGDDAIAVFAYESIAASISRLISQSSIQDTIEANTEHRGRLGRIRAVPINECLTFYRAQCNSTSGEPPLLAKVHAIALQAGLTTLHPQKYPAPAVEQIPSQIQLLEISRADVQASAQFFSERQPPTGSGNVEKILSRQDISTTPRSRGSRGGQKARDDAPWNPPDNIEVLSVRAEAPALQNSVKVMSAAALSNNLKEQYEQQRQKMTNLKKLADSPPPSARSTIVQRHVQILLTDSATDVKARVRRSLGVDSIHDYTLVKKDTGECCDAYTSIGDVSDIDWTVADKVAHFELRELVDKPASSVTPKPPTPIEGSSFKLQLRLPAHALPKGARAPRPYIVEYLGLVIRQGTNLLTTSAGPGQLQTVFMAPRRQHEDGKEHVADDISQGLERVLGERSLINIIRQELFTITREQRPLRRKWQYTAKSYNGLRRSDIVGPRLIKLRVWMIQINTQTPLDARRPWFVGKKHQPDDSKYQRLNTALARNLAAYDANSSRYTAQGALAAIPLTHHDTLSDEQFQIADILPTRVLDSVAQEDVTAGHLYVVSQPSLYEHLETLDQLHVVETVQALIEGHSAGAFLRRPNTTASVHAALTARHNSSESDTDQSDEELALSACSRPKTTTLQPRVPEGTPWIVVYLKQPYFNYIRWGYKTVESKLSTHLYRRVGPGWYVCFRTDSTSLCVWRQVKQVHVHQTFSEAARKFRNSLLPFVNVDRYYDTELEYLFYTIHQGVTAIDSVYSWNKRVSQPDSVLCWDLEYSVGRPHGISAEDLLLTGSEALFPIRTRNAFKRFQKGLFLLQAARLLDQLPQSESPDQEIDQSLPSPSDVRQSESEGSTSSGDEEEDAADITTASQVFIFTEHPRRGRQLFVHTRRDSGCLFVPGGRQEPTDTNTEQVAYRECFEETESMLPLGSIQFVCSSRGDIGGQWKLHDYVAVVDYRFCLDFGCPETNKHYNPQWISVQHAMSLSGAQVHDPLFTVRVDKAIAQANITELWSRPTCPVPTNLAWWLKRLCREWRRQVIDKQNTIYFYNEFRGPFACFSQFHFSTFSDKDGVEYSSAEQYMMVCKARAMGDKRSAELILSCEHHPHKIRQLGRAVTNFDQQVWTQLRYGCVVHGNLLKFTQNAPLLRLLVSTKFRRIAEAASHDSIWGIGISVEDAEKGKTWHGSNLLGQALMDVRRLIRGRDASAATKLYHRAYPDQAVVVTPKEYAVGEQGDDTLDTEGPQHTSAQSSDVSNTLWIPVNQANLDSDHFAKLRQQATELNELASDHQLSFACLDLPECINSGPDTFASVDHCIVARVLWTHRGYDKLSGSERSDAIQKLADMGKAPKRLSRETRRSEFINALGALTQEEQLSIATAANLLKVTSTPRLRQTLQDTGNAHLRYRSRSLIWGDGCQAPDTSLDEHPGLNLMGQALMNARAQLRRPACTYFYDIHEEFGCFSLWSNHQFTHQSQTYFSGEQFLMAAKARMFGDSTALQRILESDRASSVRRSGRNIKGFDEKRWTANMRRHAYTGCLLKFRQNPSIAAILLSTGDSHIAEAAGDNVIWGIGHGAAEGERIRLCGRDWRGSNLLGLVLMDVRRQLKADANEPQPPDEPGSPHPDYPDQADDDAEEQDKSDKGHRQQQNPSDPKAPASGSTAQEPQEQPEDTTPTKGHQQPLSTTEYIADSSILPGDSEPTVSDRFEGPQSVLRHVINTQRRWRRCLSQCTISEAEQNSSPAASDTTNKKSSETQCSGTNTDDDRTTSNNTGKLHHLGRHSGIRSKQVVSKMEIVAQWRSCLGPSSLDCHDNFERHIHGHFCIDRQNVHQAPSQPGSAKVWHAAKGCKHEGNWYNPLVCDLYGQWRPSHISRSFGEAPPLPCKDDTLDRKRWATSALDSLAQVLQDRKITTFAVQWPKEKAHQDALSEFAQRHPEITVVCVQNTSTHFRNMQATSQSRLAKASRLAYKFLKKEAAKSGSAIDRVGLCLIAAIDERVHSIIRGQSTVVSRWKSVGTIRPSSGSQLANPMLETALKQQQAFTETEVDALQLRAVPTDAFVLSAGEYFIQCNCEEEAGVYSAQSAIPCDERFGHSEFRKAVEALDQHSTAKRNEALLQQRQSIHETNEQFRTHLRQLVDNGKITREQLHDAARAPSTTRIRSESDSMQSGTSVRLEGMEDLPQWNNSEGTLGKYDKVTDKYDVHMTHSEYGSTTLAVRARHLAFLTSTTVNPADTTRVPSSAHVAISTAYNALAIKRGTFSVSTKNGPRTPARMLGVQLTNQAGESVKHVHANILDTGAATCIIGENDYEAWKLAAPDGVESVTPLETSIEHIRGIGALNLVIAWVRCTLNLGGAHVEISDMPVLRGMTGVILGNDLLGRGRALIDYDSDGSGTITFRNDHKRAISRPIPFICDDNCIAANNVVSIASAPATPQDDKDETTLGNSCPVRVRLRVSPLGTVSTRVRAIQSNSLDNLIEDIEPVAFTPEGLTIPPWCEQNIRVRVPSVGVGGSSIAYEPLGDGRERELGVLVASGIANVDQQGYVKIRVVNTSRKPVRIPLLTPLARFIVDPEIKRLDTQYNTSEIMNEIHVNPEVEPRRAAIMAFLEPRRRLFSNELGYAHAYKHEIVTPGLQPDGPDPPPKSAVKNRPPEEAQALREAVRKLQDQRLIERAPRSEYNANPMLVKKADGKWRLVLDFRLLNLHAEKDTYPLPNVESNLASLGKANWFTTIDLLQGFHQCEIDEASKHKTAFSTEDGQFQFVRMPMGLTSSPGAFMRLVDASLRGLPPGIAVAYMDDVIIPTSGTFEDHLRDVGLVFDRLIEAGFTVRCDKCYLAMREVPYLGFMVGNYGTRPLESKIAPILNMCMQRMLEDPAAPGRYAGMLGFYSSFIPDLHITLAPFHKLKGKNIDREKIRDIVMSLKFQAAFAVTKKQLSELAAKARPDLSKPFYVDCDMASSQGLAAVLSQRQDPEDPESHMPIAFWSRRFVDEELRYGVRDQECLGIVCALKQWRHYLLGAKVIVRTDHRSLQWLLSTKHPDGSRVSAWACKVQGYDLEVQYVPGKLHIVPDCLSRDAVARETERPLEEHRGGSLNILNRPDIEDRLEASSGVFAANPESLDKELDNSIRQTPSTDPELMYARPGVPTASKCAVTWAGFGIPIRRTRDCAALILLRKQSPTSPVEILVESQAGEIGLPYTAAKASGKPGYRAQLRQRLATTYEAAWLNTAVQEATPQKARKGNTTQFFLNVVVADTPDSIDSVFGHTRAGFVPLGDYVSAEAQRPDHSTDDLSICTNLLRAVYTRTSQNSTTRQPFSDIVLRLNQVHAVGEKPSAETGPPLSSPPPSPPPSPPASDTQSPPASRSPSPSCLPAETVIHTDETPHDVATSDNVTARNPPPTPAASPLQCGITGLTSELAESVEALLGLSNPPPPTFSGQLASNPPRTTWAQHIYTQCILALPTPTRALQSATWKVFPPPSPPTSPPTQSVDADSEVDIQRKNDAASTIQSWWATYRFFRDSIYVCVIQQCSATGSRLAEVHHTRRRTGVRVALEIGEDVEEQLFNYKYATLYDVFEYFISRLDIGQPETHTLHSLSGRQLTDLSKTLYEANQSRAITQYGELYIEIRPRADIVTSFSRLTVQGESSRPTGSPLPSPPLPPPPLSPVPAPSLHTTEGIEPVVFTSEGLTIPPWCEQGIRVRVSPVGASSNSIAYGPLGDGREHERDIRVTYGIANVDQQGYVRIRVINTSREPVRVPPLTPLARVNMNPEIREPSLATRSPPPSPPSSPVAFPPSSHEGSTAQAEHSVFRHGAEIFETGSYGTTWQYLTAGADVNALEQALGAARNAIRANSSTATSALRLLANAYGYNLPEISTLRAIRAVLEQSLGMHTDNRIAWEANDSTEASFEKWSALIHSTEGRQTSDGTNRDSRHAVDKQRKHSSDCDVVVLTATVAPRYNPDAVPPSPSSDNEATPSVRFDPAPKSSHAASSGIATGQQVRFYRAAMKNESAAEAFDRFDEKRSRALIELAGSLGYPNARTSSFQAISAVLCQLLRPQHYSRDRDAWEATGAKEANFRKWKSIIRPVAAAASSYPIQAEECIRPLDDPPRTVPWNGPTPECHYRVTAHDHVRPHVAQVGTDPESSCPNTATRIGDFTFKAGTKGPSTHFGAHCDALLLHLELTQQGLPVAPPPFTPPPSPPLSPPNSPPTTVEQAPVTPPPLELTPEPSEPTDPEASASYYTIQRYPSGPALIADMQSSKLAVDNIYTRLAQLATDSSPTASCIALDLEGDLGQGYVALVQICVDPASTDQSDPPLVYVFDTHLFPAMLGERGPRSLRAILENEAVVKILHSGYGDSSALFLKYGINLRGIFDTSLADCVACSRSVARQRGLQETLVAWLGEQQGTLSHKGDVEHSRGLWNKRPLTKQRFEYAYEDVTLCTQVYRLQHAFLRKQDTLEYVFAGSQQRAPPASLDEHHSQYAWPKVAYVVIRDSTHFLCIRSSTGQLSLPGCALVDSYGRGQERAATHNDHIQTPKTQVQDMWRQQMGGIPPGLIRQTLISRLRKGVRVGNALLHFAHVANLTELLSEMLQAFEQRDLPSSVSDDAIPTSPLLPQVGDTLVAQARYSETPSKPSQSTRVAPDQICAFQYISIECAREFHSNTARVASAMSIENNPADVNVVIGKTHQKVRATIIVHDESAAYVLLNPRGQASFPSGWVENGVEPADAAAKIFDSYAGPALRRSPGLSPNSQRLTPALSAKLRHGFERLIPVAPSQPASTSKQVASQCTTHWFSCYVPNLLQHRGDFYAARSADAGFTLVKKLHEPHPSFEVALISPAPVLASICVGQKGCVSLMLKVRYSISSRLAPASERTALTQALSITLEERAKAAESGYVCTADRQHTPLEPRGHISSFLDHRPGTRPEYEAHEKLFEAAVLVTLALVLQNKDTYNTAIALAARVPRDNDNDTIGTTAQFRMPSNAEMAAEQRAYPPTAQCISLLQEGEMSHVWQNANATERSRLTDSVSKMHISSSQLLVYEPYRPGGADRIVIPPKYRTSALMSVHDYAGHFGISKTFQLLQRRFWWSDDMMRDTSAYINKCRICSRCKLPHHASGQQQLIDNGEHPGDILSADLYSVGYEADGYDHTLDFVDNFSRLVIATPVQGTPDSAEVADVLISRVLGRLGKPREIRSDRASTMISKALTQLYDSMGINIVAGTAYTHKLIAVVERWHQTLKQMLLLHRTALKDKLTTDPRWYKTIPILELVYNATVNATTGYSPFFLNNIREPVLPLDMLTSQPSRGEKADELPTFVREHLEQARIVWDAANRSLYMYGLSAKMKYDLKVDVRTTFKAGDKVLLIRGKAFDKGAVHLKREDYTDGPYTVLRALPHDRYLLGNLQTRAIHDEFHISRLIQYPDRTTTPESQWNVSDPVTGGVWPVSEVTDRRPVTGRRLQKLPEGCIPLEYKIRWTGFGRLAFTGTWRYRHTLDSIAPLVAQYDSKHPLEQYPPLALEPRITDGPRPVANDEARQRRHFRHVPSSDKATTETSGVVQGVSDAISTTESPQTTTPPSEDPPSAHSPGASAQHDPTGAPSDPGYLPNIARLHNGKWQYARQRAGRLPRYLTPDHFTPRELDSDHFAKLRQQAATE